MYNGGVGGINGKASASYNGEDGNGGDNLRKKSGRKSSRNRIVRSDENTPLTSSSRSKRKQPPGKTLKERFIAVASIVASIAALVLCAIVLFTAFFGGQFKGRTRKRHAGSALIGGSDTKQLYDDMGRFIMEDYDRKPPFSDFLPAVAGYYGKPLYAFFVNRGQGIASFGIESKDYPIMEFNSANKAYQVTPFVGFRTFLKGSRRGQQFLVEPFSPLNTRHVNEEGMPRRTMFIGSNEMQLQEVDPVTELETNVTYVILPEEDFGAFVRRTKITNTGRRSVNLSILDGLAKIEPAGGKIDELLKNVGRTLEGFMGVYSPYNDTLQMPFYRLSTQPADSAAVVVQEAGHWCLSVLEKEGGMSLLPIIYDPSKVFGFDTTMLSPVELQTRSVREIIDSPQYGFAKTASAFAAVDDITLEAGGSLTITSYFGKANHVLEVPVISRRLMQLGFSEYKVSRSREIIQQITSSVETETSSKLFNAHIGQMFLDNSLRGGIPSILGDVDDDSHMRNADEDGRLKTFHLFSRIHGDLERDYNSFKIIPTFFSEGPGNFRDVSQNRRNDVMFQPRVASYNVRSFLSFLQADGYNPLTVQAPSFTIIDLEKCEEIAATAVGRADGHRAQHEMLTGILNSGPFRPGQLFQLMEDLHIELIISKQEFVDAVAAVAKDNQMAEFTTGFWADHWTYIVDLINGWLAVYPDWEERILFDTKLPYFFSPASVKPRSLKYVLSTTFDGSGKHVRQLEATIEEDAEKVAFQQQYIGEKTGWYKLEANWQHTQDGDIFRSSPMEKLFVLAAVKFATRDPFGMGIEYEAGRPGWDDANNGLAGMIGSGLSEAIELNVLLRLIHSTVEKYHKDIAIPAEAGILVDTIMDALRTLETESPALPGNTDEKPSLKVPVPLFRYWDRVASAREKYRKSVNVVFDGSTKTISSLDVLAIISEWMQEVDRGIARAESFGTRGYGDSGEYGVTPTYFAYNVVKWTETGLESSKGLPLVQAEAMEVRIFPMFLEGPARMMKLLDTESSADLYRKVRASPLRDEGLGMYTISASLKSQPFDLGREMAFAPGWLENQSVWLHMSYKFYLELLRHSLFDEFFGEMQDGGLLPFMNAENYGRSLMECSSFIASSSFEDPSVRGRGFLARLSGSTAEFLSMFILLMIGPEPFTLDPETGTLRFQLLPALPRWLFNDDGDSVWISYKLFGAIDVTYHHRRGSEDLFRALPSRYVVGFRDGQTVTVDNSFIVAGMADKIRRVVFVATIDVYFE